MTLETLAFQKAVTEDNLNGLPVRLIDPAGNPLLFGPAADANPATGILAATDMLYNGATWDRPRGANGAQFNTLGLTQQLNLSAPRTDAATVTSGDLVAPACTIALVMFRVTAISGTAPTAQLVIQSKDTQGTYSSLNGGGSATALSATGNSAFTITPNNSTSFSTFGPTFRYQVVIAGTTPSVTWYADIYYK
jgi:hypothetical protein